MKLLKKTQKWMNTDITFQGYSNTLSDLEIEEIFEQGFSQFATIVKRYSRFDPKSELSKMNSIQNSWQEITKELYYLIKYCLFVAEYTNGVFDPTIIDILEAFGYGPINDFSKLDKKEQLFLEIREILKNRKSFLDIGLKEENGKYLIKLDKKQRLDLGGMGKGFAIDKAYKVMSLAGLDNFLIDAGGDIRAKGSQIDSQYWLVGLWDSTLGLTNNEVEDKRQQAKSLIKLYSGDSLCCSGGDARKSKYFHHLINPSTGFPEDKFSHIFSYIKYHKFQIKNEIFQEIIDNLDIEPIATIADTFATAYFIDPKISNKSDIKGLDFLGIEK